MADYPGEIQRTSYTRVICRLMNAEVRNRKSWASYTRQGSISLDVWGRTSKYPQSGISVPRRVIDYLPIIRIANEPGTGVP